VIEGASGTVMTAGRGDARAAAARLFAPSAASSVLTLGFISGMTPRVDRLAGVDARRGELETLLRAVARGERDALKAVYERTSPRLYGICLRMLRDEAEAQDALQEIFTTIWRKAARFDAGKASAMTWLSVLARNKAIDRLRSRHQPVASLDDAAELASDDPSQLDVVEQAQDARRLSDCLDQLDERARTMIRAAFFDGDSYPQLAEREAVPLPTMKSWIRRGLLRLRGCLEQ
jgi:RNA polymerase sigma factor (sigma-70 family)